MIKNYFKVAFRYLLRNKGYAFINILGLAIGITCCLLIMLFVRSEWSYDHFHSKSNRIYRAWLQEKYEGQTFTNTVTPIPLAPTLAANIPEVESVCRVFASNTLVQYDGKRFNEAFSMVDSNFFQVFDFDLAQGSAQTALATSTAVVISEDLARKYFGKQDAIGKHLELQLGTEKILFTVTAIAGNTPQESSIQFDMLIPHANDRYLFSERARTSGWTNVFEETYVVTKPGFSGSDLEKKMPALAKKIAGDTYKEGVYNVHFQPITDIHLNKDLPAGNSPVSDPAYSYILGTIGILILLIACINFVTISLGRSTTRALEVGVRKVLGAERPQLIRQFWGEALLMVLIALVAAIALAFLFLEPFNTIASKELKIALDGSLVLFIIAIIVIVALIAGIYPAIVLSSYVPVKVLKGRLESAARIGLFRRSLIAGQFVASIVMIIDTIVIGKQLDFFRSKNLGYDKESTIIVATNKGRKEGIPLAKFFKEELAQNPAVKSASIGLYSLAEPGWINLGYEDDKTVYRNFRMNAIDQDFVTTTGLQIVAGRNFDAGNSADMNKAMLVNETLVKEYGWKDPIGRKLPGSYEQQVVGVVRDFHFESLHNPIQPLALVLQADSMFRHSNDVGFTIAAQPRITIRMRPGNIQQQLAGLKQTWKKVAADQEFEYRFLDETLNNMYRAEQRLGTIVHLASVLSIFIACMGLFGLATLIVARRTKEIGIRKVLGADVKGLVGLISKDFVVLVIVASLIAFPVAWWALNKWLEDFAYRIELDWWVFLLASLLSLAIALVTVSFQAIKAAIANPVKSLKVE